MSLFSALLRRMKNRILNNLRIANAIILSVLFVALTVFCYIAKLSLAIPLFLLVLGVYCVLARKSDYRLFLNLGFLLAILLFLAYTSNRYAFYSNLLIPVSAVGLLVIILYNDLYLALLMSFAASILTGLVAGNRLDIAVIYFIASVVGALRVRNARTRSELINAGFFISIFQVLCVTLLNPFPDFIFSRHFLLDYFRPLFINGLVSAMIVIATLKVFEYLFGVITNFSLLELSDLNHPLLKRMILEAPGTYHHSLLVGNLAEIAANAVGANALLCRVGSYYHDIGKIDKPEYFVENQIFESSKHDNLEPTMSRLVIFNHVINGVEVAKKYHFHPAIIDFVQQHHGKSLMHYFYQKAISEAREGEAIDEQTFRYPGPKPQTRETAIMMLADSVEGACRALEEPTPPRIDETVRKIINNKFIDGQLDECSLTLKDLEVIGMTFTRVLSAMYHTRVKYPERKNENANRRSKPPDANSLTPSPDSSQG